MVARSAFASWHFPILYSIVRDRYVPVWMTVLIVLPLCAGAGAVVEHTWSLPHGIGFSQHYGFLMIFLATPFLVLLANWVLENLAAILYAPEEFKTDDSEVAEALQRCRRAFGSWIDWSIALAFVGGAVFALRRNVVVTTAAEKFFGRDVFDSAHHSLNFYVAKVYLAIIWLLLYPVLITLGIRAIRTLVTLVRIGATRRSINVDFFGIDDCGGMTRIGKLYYKVVVIGLIFSACSFASFLTHQIYRPQITLLAWASCAVGLVTYFAALRPLHLFVAAERRVPLYRIAADLSAAYASHDWSRCANLLAIRSAVLAVNTYALPTSEAMFVILIPFVQLAIAMWVVLGAPPVAP